MTNFFEVFEYQDSLFGSYVRFWDMAAGTGNLGFNLPSVALKAAHDALRGKLLPDVYEYGFLNPDVKLFA